MSCSNRNRIDILGTWWSFIMLYVSSLLSFQYYSNTLESAPSSTILTVIFLFCFLISFVMCDPDKKKRKAWQDLEKIPGPRAFPLIGNAPHLMFPPDEIFTWMEGVNRKWGEIVLFWLFGNPKVFVNSYDIAMQLLSRKTFLLKSEEFEPLNPVGGQSLVGASPEIHPLRRKMLGPGFSRQVVDNSLEIFCRHARKLRDSLMIYADNGEAFNVMDNTGLCAYKIGCEAALGHAVVQDIWDVNYKEQIQAWHTLLVHIVKRSFKPWLKYDFLYSRTEDGKVVQQCFQTINKFSERVLFVRRQRWEFLKANKFYDENTTQTTEVKPECFADLLLDLEDKKELTREQVLHELNIYIVAGYDTTGTTLAWILHLLATHPEVQEKCYQEILEILQENDSTQQQESKPGSSSSTPKPPSPPPPSFNTFTTIFSLIFATSDLPLTINQLKRMKYLDWVIKEALRLFPVLPWLLRRTDEDVELNDGRVIPAGVDVPINTFIIHRDPKNFPDPEQFIPERHSSEGSGPSCLLPFGAGPRICPGMTFATQEMKVVLTHLLLAFKWEAGNEEEKKDALDNGGGKKKCLFHGVLVPATGISVKISKRHDDQKLSEE